MSDQIEEVPDASLAEVRDLLARSVELQERGIARFDKERYWRRLAVTVIAVVALVAVVGLGGWTSMQRQSDCDRANRQRASQRAEPVEEWTIAWRVLAGDSEPEKRDALLDALAAGAAERNPPRDCAWPA